MKRTFLPLLASLTLLAGCISGPTRLSRAFDDYRNQKYCDDPWIHGALLNEIIPVYGVVGFVATIGDVLAVNPYYFWTKDVWAREGTGYTHDQPEAPKLVEGWKNAE